MPGSGELQGVYSPASKPYEEAQKPPSQLASNPGRLNRDTIQKVEALPLLTAQVLGPGLPSKSLNEFTISQVPTEQVRTEVSKAPSGNETRQAKFESEKAETIGRLEKGIAKLKRKKFYTKRHTSPANESVNRKIRHLKSSLSKARKALSEAKKLVRQEQSASKQYRLPPEHFRTEIESLQARAEQGVQQYGKDLKKAQAEKKVLDQQQRALDKKQKAEKAAKKKAERIERQDQKVLDRQLKLDRQQNQAMQVKQEEAGKNPVDAHRYRSAQANTSQASSKVANPTSTKEAAPPRTRQTIPIHYASKPLQEDKLDMKRFLTGFKAKEGQAVKQLEDQIWAIRTPKDFKQALIDVGAAKADLNTKARLRSLISSALLGFIKDVDKFKQVNREFVAHVMYGHNMPEINKAYSASVAKLSAKLDAKQSGSG